MATGSFMTGLWDQAKGAIGNAFTGGLGGLVSSGFGALTSSLFGPSIKKQLKWQKEAQMELNEQAAKLNYDYGEKSAENAYNRQMAMYERSYEDQSYKAMRNQMEDAGLSAGLMYGSGASGGGAGSMSGAPQGQTGGAVAGDASAGLALALEAQKMKMQQALTNAEISLKNAETDQVKANTEKTGQEAETERRIREARVELTKQEGFRVWIENIHRKWEDMEYLFNEDGEVEDYVTEHQLYGTYAILGKALNNQTAINKAASVVLANQGMQAQNDKVRQEIKKITQEILTGQAEAALKSAEAAAARAKEYQTKLESGELTNWKTWLDYGFKTVDALCRIVSTAGGVMGFGKIAKFLKGQAKRRSGGVIPREYEELLDSMN